MRADVTKNVAAFLPPQITVCTAFINLLFIREANQWEEIAAINAELPYSQKV
ncbi:hypothetical protein [Gloeocapsopsis sp. IPPAS B-1203]|uniref:hypothetical protein n=1 Tax=Gloeocapsopsis sp. IPPAS B-1203 TaxID=2049454 RepID=UPI00338FA9AF